MICPICGKPAAPRPENRSAPFCSDRCRLLDLGNWLGETYRVAGERAGDGAPQLAREPRARDDDEEDPA